MCLDKITKKHDKPISGRGWKVFDTYRGLKSEYFSCDKSFKKGVYMDEKDYRSDGCKNYKYIYALGRIRYKYGWHILTKRPKSDKGYKVVRVRYRGGHTEGRDGTYFTNKTIVATEMMIGGRK